MVRSLLACVYLFVPRKCKHLRVRETMACDAICRDCDKNLGFIQGWRDSIGKNPEAHEVSNIPPYPRPWK